MELTLNQIVAACQSFASQHKQLKAFFFGDLWEYANNKQDLFPVLTCTLTGSSLNDGVDATKLQFGIFDILNNDRTNELEVLSDCKLIAKDLIAYFKSPLFDDLFIQSNIELNDWVDKLDHELGGFFFDCELKQSYQYDLCSVPLIVTTPAYQPETLAVLAQYLIQPSTAFISALDTLILSLKTANNWNNLDALWILATEQQQHALINIKNPSGNNLILKNNPLFTPNKGFKGDGLTQSINTNLLVSSLTNYNTNLGCFGCYIQENIALTNAIDMGYANNTSGSFLLSNTANTFNAALLSSNIATSNNSSSGLLSVVRTSNTSVSLFKNGNNLYTSNTATLINIVSPAYFYLLSLYYINSLNASNFSTRTLSFAFIGGKTINQMSLFNSLQQFATTRGFNV